MKRNKICVYAICKNEEKNMRRWIDSLVDADMICVLDTGSTDRTINILVDQCEKQKSFNWCEYYKNDEVFNFSDARNEALDFAKSFMQDPKEWIFVSLDIDEYIEKDGLNKIKNNWNEDYDTMSLNGYTENAEPQIVKHKIHKDDITWIRPVHEIITIPNKKEKDWNVNYIDIKYNHKQDLTKNRNYYEKLKYAYNNGDKTSTTLIYLAWEAINHNDFKNYEKYTRECMLSIIQNQDDEHFNDMEYYCQCLFNLAYCNRIKGYIDIEKYCLECILKEKNIFKFRRIFKEMGNFYWRQNDYKNALFYFEECLKITNVPICWIEETIEDWTLYTDISNCYYYLKDFNKSLEYAEMAYKLNNNEITKNNLDAIKKLNTFICVYAICKNEIIFIDKWIDSVREADEIVVLDTGSTDGSYEYLKELSNKMNNLKVYKKDYNTFRFDDARNDALDFALKSNADVYVSVDFDEWFELGWSNHIREAWIKNKYERVEYWYSHEEDANGNPKDIYHYNKIHTQGWRWKGAVHEYLIKPGFDEESERTAALDLFDKVKLYHHPDYTKERNYLDLLEVRAKEENDINGRFYLSREYMKISNYQKAIDLLLSIVDEDDNSFYKMCAYTWIGECYYHLNDLDNALIYNNKALEIDNTYRCIWFNLAEIYHSKGNNWLAIRYIEDALVCCYNHQNWFETGEEWNGKAYDLLSLFYYDIGEYEKSFDNVELALEKYPNDERIINNRKLIKEKL